MAYTLTKVASTLDLRFEAAMEYRRDKKNHVCIVVDYALEQINFIAK